MKPDTLTSELAAYVNGTLDATRRMAVEELIAGDPKVKLRYVFLQTMRNTMIGSLPKIPDDYGLAALKQRIAADKKHAHHAASIKPGLLAQFIQWCFTPSLSFAVTAFFFVLQLGIVVAVMRDSAPDYAEYRAAPQSATVAGPFIRISFNSSAREEDIRYLLIATGVSIIGGPTQLGDYYLYVSPDRMDWAVKQFRQSPIVDQANVIAKLPQAKE